MPVFFNAFSKAVVSDNLLNLSHRVFNGSGSSVKGKLGQLLTGVATFLCWPELTHLDLTRCSLDQNDAENCLSSCPKMCCSFSRVVVISHICRFYPGYRIRHLQRNDVKSDFFRDTRTFIQICPQS